MSVTLDLQRREEMGYHLASQCVREYFDVFNNKKIEIWMSSQKELTATVYNVDKFGRTSCVANNLPLCNLSKEIASQCDIAAIQCFFDQTYLVPEKGKDGFYNRVSVRVEGPGAGRSTIPYQPGLALGSVVRGSSLEKMENYAETMAKQQMFEEQISNAEKQIELLNSKIASKSKDTSAAAKALVAVWTQQSENTVTAMGELVKKIADTTPEIPIFEGFHQALESPIDMGKSKMEIQPRGFDSLEYSSQYIRLDQEVSAIHDKVMQSSSANSVSLGGGGGLLFKAKANVSHSWASGIAERITQIKKEGIAQGVLMINATVTTRNVRCFTDLKWDKAKLMMLQSAMRLDDEKISNRYGITTDADGKKSIYLLTEAVLGGAFTALVTFMNKNDMQRNIKKKHKEKTQHTSASASVGWGPWSVKGGYSRASMNASEAEDDVMQSTINTNVNIEMFSHGAIPAFARQIVKNEIMKHKNLDPSQNELTLKEEAETEEYIKAFNGSADQEKKDIMIAKQNMKMAKGLEASMNRIRAAEFEKRQQNIHTMESVIEGYEDFTKQITQDDKCGFPVGFNYRVISKDDIDLLIRDFDRLNQSADRPTNPRENVQGSARSTNIQESMQGNVSDIM